MHHEKQSTLSSRNRSFECRIADDRCFRAANGNTPSISYTATIINSRFEGKKLFCGSSWRISCPAIIRSDNTNGSGNLFFSCGVMQLKKDKLSDEKVLEIAINYVNIVYFVFFSIALFFNSSPPPKSIKGSRFP